jgi:hypothetical protein
VGWAVAVREMRGNKKRAKCFKRVIIVSIRA